MRLRTEIKTKNYPEQQTPLEGLKFEISKEHEVCKGGALTEADGVARLISSSLKDVERRLKLIAVKCLGKWNLSINIFSPLVAARCCCCCGCRICLSFSWVFGLFNPPHDEAEEKRLSLSVCVCWFSKVHETASFSASPPKPKSRHETLTCCWSIQLYQKTVLLSAHNPFLLQAFFNFHPQAASMK